MNWIPLAKGTLPPTTPHPKILVTNNLPARDAHGHMSHVWLVSMVHHDSTDDSWAAFEGDAKLWGLTHWRYAMPEETAHTVQEPAALTHTYDPESDVTEGGTVNSKKCNEAQKMEDELCAAINALESALRLVLAQRVPPGCVVVPRERLTVEEIKTLRQQVRNDPRCQDEHWFVLMARAIEDRYLAAALTDQSQKKESP